MKSSSEQNLSDLNKIARIREAQRLLPGNDDLAGVRSELEEEVGEAVSRRVAARFLGVSHTALQKWIESGDVPVVFTPNGRLDVPISELFLLRDEITKELERNPDSRYVIKPRAYAARRRAEQMKIGRKRQQRNELAHGHASAETRAAIYHDVIADQLSLPMVREAKHRLAKWRQSGKIDPHYALQWENILALTLPQMRQAITDPGQTGIDLRQNSPFAGLLSEPERAVINEVLHQT